MTLRDKFKISLIISPNGLSVLRAVFGLILPLFILQEKALFHFGAVVLFTVGALTDYWDGLLARKLGQVTAFGKFVDPLADKILILGTMAAFSIKGFYSIWWLVPIFFREIVITFCRIGWLREGKSIGAETLGKWKLCAQVFVVSFSLLYLLVSDWPWLAWLGPALPIAIHVSMVLAFGLTVWSGITFSISNRGLFLTREFAKFVSALGVGFSPWAPGTLGSGVGLLLIFLCHWNPYLYLVILLMLAAAGGWAVFRLNLAKDEDPSFVVVDEACGMMLTMLFLPLGWASALTGFFLFRLFDVLKPFPVCRLERIPGYWGILLDDLGAGVYAWIILRILF